MTFEKDPSLGPDVASFYGDYKGTFRSENAQVRADFFSAAGILVAYVSFGRGVDKASVTDTYLGEIRTIASKLGFTDKFRLLFS
ncbi:hypothetical protein [Chondromyces apiculatus]|uniref:Uncharacterized protein n=1 Tax=Chondromyces apiculatus DSM 436 TaxID=1192034 RepID=A0A017TBR2_9BACT|nr:hypothetical protein [Chondromyces apiculatus]EYF06728.1 Hypothetical protein CAP_1425 [Chondromyces apiculatus DSM 436]